MLITPAQIKALYDTRTAQICNISLAQLKGEWEGEGDPGDPWSRNFFKVTELAYGCDAQAMGTCEIDDHIYLYIKADTPVRKWARKWTNRFAPFVRTRREAFGSMVFVAWRFDPEMVDLIQLDREEEQRVWNEVYELPHQRRLVMREPGRHQDRIDLILRQNCSNMQISVADHAKVVRHGLQAVFREPNITDEALRQIIIGFVQTIRFGGTAEIAPPVPDGETLRT
jgi:hypothetical protein